MTYQPLHHKYRPKKFSELVGQDAIAQTLTNALSLNKIAPAYLLTGPRGTGKTSSARILAKSLNCLNSPHPTAEPCGVCDVCQGITKGYSLDVIEIDAASNTGVDNIRELIEKAQFAPVQCRYKVYVIDECHMLSTAAFNALLKTLEEPPKHVIFILATTDPQRVLPTIISRCQRFDFRRIQLDAMVNHLSAIAVKEAININKEALTLIAQISQGGLRDAESLLDQLSLTVGEVTPDKVWSLVGSVSEHDLIRLLGAIASKDPEGVLDIARRILDSGREPLIILQNLAGVYRDLLIAKSAPSRQDLITCTPQTWTGLVEYAKQLEMSQILQGQQHLRMAELQIKNTTQPRLWLEVVLLGLFAVESPVVAAPTPKTLPIQTQITQKKTEPVKQPEPVDATEPDALDLDQIWEKVAASVTAMSLRAMIRQMAYLIELNDDTAKVAVKPKFLSRLVKESTAIEVGLQNVLGRPVKVTIEELTKDTIIPEKKTVIKTKTVPPAIAPTDNSTGENSDDVKLAAAKLARFFSGVIIKQEEEEAVPVLAHTTGDDFGLTVDDDK